MSSNKPFRSYNSNTKCWSCLVCKAMSTLAGSARQASNVPIHKVGRGMAGTNGSELVTKVKLYDFLVTLLQKRVKN